MLSTASRRLGWMAGRFPAMNRTRGKHTWRRAVASSYVMFKKTQRYLPPVVRGLLGLLLVMLGLLGFLPVIGFWMIPLGIGVLATDIPPLKRWLRGKIKKRRR